MLDWQQFPWWQETAETTGRVTRDFALAVPAVLRARNIIVGTIASLPIEVLDTDNNVVRSPLLEQIDPDVPNPVTIASLVEDVIFEAIGWLQVLGRDANNYPVWARRVDPDVVSAQPPPGFILADLPSGFVLGSTLWVGGIPTPARDMIRFDSPNPPLLVTGARAIRRAAKYENAAEMFANSPGLRGWFTPNEDADPDQDEIDASMDDWEARRRARSTGYVPSSLKYVQADVMSPVDLQLADLIDKATVGIANAFGVDSEDLNVSTTTRTYTNAVDRRQDAINATYAPIVAAVSARLSMGDVTRRGQRVCLGWDRYLEPNPTDRAAIAVSLKGAGLVTTDEYRHDEGRPALTAAQRRELAPPAPATQPATAQPSSAANDGPLATVTRIAGHSRQAASFAADPGLVFGPDRTGVAGAFQVDVERRTITGLVMPWNEIGRSGGLQWRFSRNSLQFDYAQINRIKLLIDHDNSQPVGRLERTWSDEVGQWGTFRVARGPAGDQALAMAADGARDGLSVGIGYAGDDAGFSFMDDPLAAGVRLVTAAPWRETSLVALPAFAGARATAVRMTAYPTGVPMQCNYCGQVHAPGIACPSMPNPQAQQGQFQGQQAPQPQAQQGQQFGQYNQGGQNGQQAPAQPTYTPQQAAAMFAALQANNAGNGNQGQNGNHGQNGNASNGNQAQNANQNAGPLAATYTPDQLSAMFAAFTAGPHHTPETPAVVDPLARPMPGQQGQAQAQGQGQGQAQVTEQPLYRFDGNKGQRSFITDVANRFGGDSELREKASKFIAAQMKLAFANITVSNTTTLNPAIQRPDLYVGRLSFSRPIGSMVTGGVVDEITRSTLPKFSAASGLVATHVEGTEPTEGSFSTTSQNVDPKAISGLLKVNREVVDQGGTPQTDQVMWDIMTQFYAELLETRLVDSLQALSLSDTPIVGVDGELQADILAEFAGLQFIRGGDRYTGFALNSDLYSAITGAVDGDGRPLFPLLAPQNAVGTVASDLSSVRVAGKVGVPAWALASGNGGPDKSFLLVPGSVYQWFSPPTRIDLDRVAVSYVGIGIWGYSAEFTSRDTDVIQLAYTAS